MRTYFLLLAFLAVVGCSSSNQDKKAELSDQQAVVDEGVTVDVISLLSNAEKYDGKEVLVTGTVVHVCKHSGKRLHLMASDEKTKIRLESGEIGQFERELEGSDIIAKGVFHREVIDEEHLAKWSEQLENEGKGEHKSHEEQEEEEGKIKQYRAMMGETAEGNIENFWIEGISFETKSL